MITTTETCAVCRCDGVKVTHGVRNERGSFVHLEECPECGEHCPVVCYDCSNCIRVVGDQGKAPEWLSEAHASDVRGPAPAKAGEKDEGGSRKSG